MVVKGKGKAQAKKKVGEMSENRESDQSTLKLILHPSQSGIMINLGHHLDMVI